MKSIYMEDRLLAVKIVASEQNISISYENNNQDEKENQSPDGTKSSRWASEVRQTVIKFKRKLRLGQRMIGTRVQVKYEENVEG